MLICRGVVVHYFKNPAAKLETVSKYANIAIYIFLPVHFKNIGSFKRLSVKFSNSNFLRS